MALKFKDVLLHASFNVASGGDLTLVMAFTAPTFQLSEAAIVGSSADENMYHHHTSILKNLC